MFEFLGDPFAKLLNRRAAAPRFLPDRVIESLALRPGETVADLGSGGGYFTLRFARAVGPTGKVLAVDMNARLLDFVKRLAVDQGLANIVPVLTDGSPDAIPPRSVDLAFMRNTYHHLADPVGFFASLKKCLKPGARVVVIDYGESSGLFSFHRIFGHRVTRAKVLDQMAAAGYERGEAFEFLPEQVFLTFRPIGPAPEREAVSAASARPATP